MDRDRAIKALERRRQHLRDRALLKHDGVSYDRAEIGALTVAINCLAAVHTIKVKRVSEEEME